MKKVKEVFGAAQVEEIVAGAAARGENPMFDPSLLARQVAKTGWFDTMVGIIQGELDEVKDSGGRPASAGVEVGVECRVRMTLALERIADALEKQAAAGDRT